jgi:hypothetical protein
MFPYCNRQRPTIRSHSGRWPRTPRAYTFVELVATMAASTVLVGGLASTAMISSRAISTDVSAGSDSNRSTLALARLASDVRQAMRFTERTASAITVIVPDRDGDLNHEKIRYSWSGTIGDPLLYKYNNEPAVTAVADVRQFDLTAVTRSITADAVLPPPAPVVYETFTEGKASSDTISVSIASPTGTNTGKLLIAAVAVDGASGASLTAPVGWTLLSSVNNGGQVGLAVWWKIGTAAEPPTHIFTWTGAEQAYGWIMRFSGANPLAPINVFNSAVGTSATPICPTVTTTEGYALVLRIGGFDVDKININNAGMAQNTTISVDRSNSDSSAVSGGSAYRNQAPPGATGTSTFALTGSEEYVTFTLAIAPQPSN